MNSFETDLKRALTSKGFLLGLALELVILAVAGPDSEVFRVCVPVLCTLPYAAAWLDDVQSGYLKFYLSRCSKAGYIWGKFWACALSGGLLEIAGFGVFLWVEGAGQTAVSPGLLFGSACVWAGVAAILAAWSNSRYLAYGGAFVVYYLLIILNERYFAGLYCLNPVEWLAPSHTWVFEELGVGLLLVAMLAVVAVLYYEVVRRRMADG